jgi:hypothetical protein
MVVGVWKIVVRDDVGDFDQYGTDDVELIMRWVSGTLSGVQPPIVKIKSEQGIEWYPETSPFWIRDSNESHLYRIVTGDLSANVNLMIPFLPSDSQFIFDTITNTFQEAQEFEDVLKLSPIALPSGDADFGQIVVDSGDSNKLKYVNPSGVAFDLLAAAGAGAPTNATYLTVTTNGTLTQERTLAAGDGISYTDGGAGGAYTPYFNTIDLAKKRIQFIEDFFGDAANEGSGVFRTTRSGTGADITNIAVTETGVFGVWQLSTGTTVSGRAGLKAGDVNSFCLGQGVAILEFKIKIPAASSAVEEFIIRCGFGDNTTGATTDGLIFVYDRATSTFWQMQNKTNTVATTNISSTAVGVGWVRLKVVVNAAASSVSYYINDVELSNSPSTLNIPSGTSRMLTAILSITKSVGSSNRTVEVDYSALDIKLTSPR